jgi:methyl-accepting chemotaxis protein
MKLSLQKRLMISIGFTVCFSLIVTNLATDSASKKLINETLTQQYKNNLVAKRESVKQQISDYFSLIQQQVSTMANDVSIQDSVTQFIPAFNSYTEQRNYSPELERSTVKQYYENEFSSTYQRLNENSAPTAIMFSQLAPATLAFQYDYISKNIHPQGKKDQLNATENATAYDNVHRRYHGSIRQFLSAFGYYDIFIADAKSGNVVYSVFKELDFATNLVTGPYAKTGLGQAFNKALTLKNGQSYLTDFSAYLPSYDNPASFISSPIYINNQLVAVLIFQMPIDRINDIMTHGQKWQEKGFGLSGETYLVGADKTLRNESRFLIEDKKGYIDALKTSKLENVELIDIKNTGISLQKVDSIGVKAALRGETGFEIFKDYRGVEVVSAYSPLKVGNLTWAILAEIDQEEAFAPTQYVSGQLMFYGLMIIIIMLLLSLIFAFFLSKVLVKPLKSIGDHFNELSHGDANLTVKIAESNIPEINTIVSGFNQFVNQLHNIISQVKVNAETITTASLQLSQMSTSSNKIAQIQNQESDAVSSSIVQFTESINEVAKNSAFASSQTSDANTHILKNTEKARSAQQNIDSLVTEVNDSANTIKKLQLEVGNINEILTVINSIADQTNLLALNAAIEAARAGEHGRGFAVVADEVRTLASKTQESTVDIQSKIEQLTLVANAAVSSMVRASSSADNGIALVKEVSFSLDELSDNITQLVQVNEIVASANEQQKYTCDTINNNVSVLADAANKMHQTSDEVAQSTDQLNTIANDLSLLVFRFKT